MTVIGIQVGVKSRIENVDFKDKFANHFGTVGAKHFPTTIELPFTMFNFIWS